MERFVCGRSGAVDREGVKGYRARTLYLGRGAAKQVLTDRQHSPLRQHEVVRSRRSLCQLCGYSREQVFMRKIAFLHGGACSSP